MGIDRWLILELDSVTLIINKAIIKEQIPPKYPIPQPTPETFPTLLVVLIWDKNEELIFSPIE